MGSQLSYISPRACELLKLETLNIKTFGGHHSTKPLNQVRFCVKDVSGNESMYVTAFVSDICQPLTGQTINCATKNYNHLKHLRLADEKPDCCDLSVDVLIGTDHYWSFFNNSIIKGDLCEPVAMSFKLGYILSGPVANTESQSMATTNTVVSAHAMKINSEICSENAKLSANLETFWNLESIGINNNEPSVYDTFRQDFVSLFWLSMLKTHRRPERKGRYGRKWPLRRKIIILVMIWRQFYLPLMIIYWTKMKNSLQK